MVKVKSYIRLLCAYRSFIYGSVSREFQSRYRNSLLGGAWTILNPLAMILVYTLIFSQIMGSRLPGINTPYAYSIFLMAGLLPWSLFAEIITRGQTMFLDNASLLKKMSFPKICLPIVMLCNALINFFIIFILFQLFLVLIGQFPGWLLLSYFPVLLLQIFFALGLALMLGVLNVFFRDVGQFFGIFLQFWFWLTPVIYSINIIPISVRSYLRFNPMTSIIVAYQQIFIEHVIPDWSSLLPTLLVACVLNLLAFNLYRKRSEEMVDEL